LLRLAVPLLKVCLLACVLAALCHADSIEYSFDYVATSGPIESFSFSLIEPGFVPSGPLPDFTAFAVTDGTNSWTMTAGSLSPEGCFEFGTPFATLGEPPFTCSVGVGGPGFSQGGFYVVANGLSGPPTTLGSSTVGIGGSFDTAAGFEYLSNDTGTMTLTISDATVTPEPAEDSLAAIGLLALFAFVRRKSKQPI
jgi:hypothetical protein